LNVSKVMSMDPRDLWAALPPALRRQIVEDVAAVLAEVSREVRADQANSSDAQGGRLYPPVDAPSGGQQSGSLRLQYALRERAHERGWHEADIDVIDADLGLSGASAAGRSKNWWGGSVSAKSG
jgi:hypothetical protein